MANLTRQRLRQRLRARFGRRGAAMVEYGLLLLISVPIMVGITQGGVTLYNTYTGVRGEILKPVP